MKETNTSQWEKLSSEVLSGMKEWAVQHPKATFAEIERETMKRMAQLQSRIMEDVVRTIEAKQAQGQPEEPYCPECGGEMQPRGEQERRIQVQGGQEVQIKRPYLVCPKCGAGFFPPG